MTKLKLYKKLHKFVVENQIENCFCLIRLGDEENEYPDFLCYTSEEIETPGSFLDFLTEFLANHENPRFNMSMFKQAMEIAEDDLRIEDATFFFDEEGNLGEVVVPKLSRL